MDISELPPFSLLEWSGSSQLAQASPFLKGLFHILNVKVNSFYNNLLLLHT